MKRWIFAAGIYLLSFFGFAGAGSTGGGFVVVCEKDRQARSVETLDLYEAKYRYGLQLLASTGSAEADYYAQGLASLKTFLGVDVGEEHRQRIKDDYRRWQDSMTFIRGGSLPPTNDLGKVVKLPNHCKIRIAALYNRERGTMKIDRELWGELSPQSKAALLAHEVHYNSIPSFDKSSEAIRKIVGMLFSTTPSKGWRHPLFDSEPTMVCWASDGKNRCEPGKRCTVEKNLTQFVIQEADGKSKIVFSRMFFGRGMLFSAYALFPPDSENKGFTVPIESDVYGDLVLKVSKNKGGRIVELALLDGKRSNPLAKVSKFRCQEPPADSRRSGIEFELAEN